MNKITFKTSNGGTLEVSQEQHDGPVILAHCDRNGPRGEPSIVPAGGMVQLVNLYRYVKRYDLADSFINPAGQAAEKDGSIQHARRAAGENPEAARAGRIPIWFFLFQDGDAGYHIYRRPVDEFNPDPARREEVNTISEALRRDFVAAHGGNILAAWPAEQVVEVADIADFPLDIHD